MSASRSKTPKKDSQTIIGLAYYFVNVKIKIEITVNINTQVGNMLRCTDWTVI